MSKFRSRSSLHKIDFYRFLTKKGDITAMKVYKELLTTVLRDGEIHHNRTGSDTLSTFGQQVKIDMSEGFPLLTLRKLPFRWIAMELFWMLAGSTDANELAAHDVHTWDAWATAEKCKEFGRRQGDLGPTYGWLLRHFGGMYMPTQEQRVWERVSGSNQQNGHDQLWQLCSDMDTDPYSRRLLLSQYDPVSAWEVEVPPCAPLIQVKIHDEYSMSLRVDMRSSDVFVGLAFDIAHFALLLEILAWCTVRRPRWLILHIGDCHIYQKHMPLVEELMKRDPKPLPKLYISKPMYHATPSQPGQDNFVNILQLGYKHLTLMDYNPHPKLYPEVVV